MNKFYIVYDNVQDEILECFKRKARAHRYIWSVHLIDPDKVDDLEVVEVEEISTEDK